MNYAPRALRFPFLLALAFCASSAGAQLPPSSSFPPFEIRCSPTRVAADGSTPPDLRLTVIPGAKGARALQQISLAPAHAKHPLRPSDSEVAKGFQLYDAFATEWTPFNGNVDTLLPGALIVDEAILFGRPGNAIYRSTNYRC